MVGRWLRVLAAIGLLAAGSGCGDETQMPYMPKLGSTDASMGDGDLTGDGDGASRCDSDTSYAGTKLVSPGEPDASYPINELTGVGLCFGSRMPKGGSPMSSANLDVLRAWIGAGAPDN